MGFQFNSIQPKAEFLCFYTDFPLCSKSIYLMLVIILWNFLFNLLYFVPLLYAKVILLLKVWLKILWQILHLEFVLDEDWVSKWDSLNTENIQFDEKDNVLIYSPYLFFLKICRNQRIINSFTGTLSAFAVSFKISLSFSFSNVNVTLPENSLI